MRGTVIQATTGIKEGQDNLAVPEAAVNRAGRYLHSKEENMRKKLLDRERAKVLLLRSCQNILVTGAGREGCLQIRSRRPYSIQRL